MSKFERIRYPDGQVSAKWIEHDANYIIKERINSYEDLMYVRAIADIFQFKGISKTLFIPCLFGQRSDRRFAGNQSFDLKLIAEVINNCKFERVEILDPHSDVALALINNSEKISSYEYVHQAVHDLYMPEKGINTCNFTLVSPDAGAYKKVFEFGEKLNVPVMGAMKHRDKDGTIAISFTHDVEGKDCLIVDDLCDGGATFITLAKRLKELGAMKVHLYVTHGLFSKGFGPFIDIIDSIYCTNSVKDLNFRDISTEDGYFNLITQYAVI